MFSKSCDKSLLLSAAAGVNKETAPQTAANAALAPGIELIRALQETFWPTLYPVIEEGGDLELRVITVEAVAGLIAAAARKIPLTKNGLSYEDYLAARIVGYEKDATTDAKQEARKDAIDHGRLTAEDFDHAFAAPKSFYVDANAALAESIEATERLDKYLQQAYGDNAPNLAKLRDGLAEVHQIAELLLNERRKPSQIPCRLPKNRSRAQRASQPRRERERTAKLPARFGRGWP